MTDGPIFKAEDGSLWRWNAFRSDLQRLAAVSTAEQLGTRAASEPNTSVEVERLLDAAAEYLKDTYGASYGLDNPIDRNRILAALSRKQEPGVPTPGDWIEWSGGPNPVGHCDVVEAKRLDGSIVTKAAFKFDWKRGPIAHGSDIIAYRIVPTPGGEGE